MNPSSPGGALTDETYARAALTYLAEPADRWLSELIRVHGAARTLDAIRSGRLPDAGGSVGRPPLSQRRAMQRRPWSAGGCA